MINTNRANLISHTETTKEIPNHFIYFSLHTVHSRREIELRLVFFFYFYSVHKVIERSFLALENQCLRFVSHRIASYVVIIQCCRFKRKFRNLNTYRNQTSLSIECIIQKNGHFHLHISMFVRTIAAFVLCSIH